jgi:hypothetical protein
MRMLKSYINSFSPTTLMHKRNRVALFLMLPIVIFIWFVGWSLYWIGSRREVGKPRKNIDQKELTFTVLMPEEKYAT